MRIFYGTKEIKEYLSSFSVIITKKKKIHEKIKKNTIILDNLA